MNKRSITFLLPAPPFEPGGGAKVIYEYANRLVADNWNVTIAYRYLFEYDRKNFIRYIISHLHFLWQYFIGGCLSGRRWFILDNRVNETVYAFHYHFVPKSTCYVATVHTTARLLNTFPIDPNHKFYIIQGHDIYDPIKDADIRTTFHYKMTKFVISHWLKDIVEGEEHEPCTLLPNGFNFDYFKLSIPPEKRNRYTVSLLYRQESFKGTAVAIQSLRLVKKVYPQLKVTLFGTSQNKEDIEEWMEYCQLPNREKINYIYNNSAIFVAASVCEGFGLTIGESMICGCAVACTNTTGFLEMVRDGETGLLSPVGDIKSLANNIIRLIEDDSLRIRLARQGHSFIQRFTWDISYNMLHDAINQAILG